MKLTKIRQQGYKALIEALGVVGTLSTLSTLRFLQQLGVGYGDLYQRMSSMVDQFTIESFRNYIG